MRIVLIGSANGSTNLGDEAMWLRAAEVTRVVFPEATIVTDGPADWQPQQDVGALKTRSFLHQDLLRLAPRPGNKMRTAASVLLNLGLAHRVARAVLAPTALPKRWENVGGWRDEIAGGDALIFTGAGAFTSESALHSIAAWGLKVRYARDANIPVAFVGQGFGPLADSLYSECVAGMLRTATLVTSRDEDAFRDFGILLRESSTKLHPGWDWAAGLEPSAADYENADSKVREWFAGTSPVGISLHSRKSASSALIARVVETVSATLERELPGVPVLLIPNARSGSHNDDRRILESLGSQLSGRHVRLFDENANARSTRAAISRCRILVTSRYHPAVFAQAEGVDTVAISYDAYYSRKFSGASLPGVASLQTVPVDGLDYERLAASVRVASVPPVPQSRSCRQSVLATERPFIEWLEDLPSD